VGGRVLEDPLEALDRDLELAHALERRLFLLALEALGGILERLALATDDALDGGPYLRASLAEMHGLDSFCGRILPRNGPGQEAHRLLRRELDERGVDEPLVLARAPAL